jgi:hypothetical protein
VSAQRDLYDYCTLTLGLQLPPFESLNNFTVRADLYGVSVSTTLIYYPGRAS